MLINPYIQSTKSIVMNNNYPIGDNNMLTYPDSTHSIDQILALGGSVYSSPSGTFGVLSYIPSGWAAICYSYWKNRNKKK